MSIKHSLDTYSQLSIKLLSSCHARSEEDTEVMLTRRIELFKGESSCLEFAVATKQEEFVAQPAVQVKNTLRLSKISFIVFLGGWGELACVMQPFFSTKLFLSEAFGIKILVNKN